MNEAILKLWRQAANTWGAESILNRVPKFVEEPVARSGGLAVLGLNPSFPSPKRLLAMAGFRQFMADHPALLYPDHFHWNTSPVASKNPFAALEGTITAMAELHVQARNWYTTWFGRINEIAAALHVGVMDYAHLDIYLWLTADSGEVDALRMAYPELARAQESIFLRLLFKHQPSQIVCAYATDVADHLQKLVRTEGDRFGLHFGGPFQPVDSITPLSRALLIFPDGHQAHVYRPVGNPIPCGSHPMSNIKFQQVRTYFEKLGHA